MAGNTAACRKIWCWRRSSVFYIWIPRQQKERDTGPGLSFWNFKVHLQWHTLSNRDTPTPTRPHVSIILNNGTPCHLWEPFSLKLPHQGSTYLRQVVLSSHLQSSAEKDECLCVQCSALFLCSRTVHSSKSENDVTYSQTGSSYFLWGSQAIPHRNTHRAI